MDDSVLFLGTGGSMGIPMIGCHCPVCSSSDPKNKRLRPSILVQIHEKKILVDAGPDLRQQALLHKIDSIDGVIITHAHEDHVGGVDDLRVYSIRSNKPLPLLLSSVSLKDLQSRFSYIFNHTAQGIVTKFDVQELVGDEGTHEFLGEEIKYFSYEQLGTKVTGFRIKNFAYVTDICEYPESIFNHLKNLDVLVVSALRHKASNLHFTVKQAIEFAKIVGAKKTYFTHIAHELDHAETSALLPEGIELSYDGLKVSI